MKFFVFNLILELEKRILLNFLLNWFVPDSTLISAIFGLKYSFCTGDVNVIAVLWIGSYNKPLHTLRTFHPELVNFGWMKITYPCFDSIETHSLGDHVLTTFTTNVKWRLIPDFSTAHSLPFDYFERLLLGKLAFLGWYFFGIVVFGYVEVISTSCG